MLAFGGPAALPAAADVFKCRGDAVSPVYQDTPCAKGRELRDFQADPPNVSVVPFAKGAPAASVAPARTTTRHKTDSDSAHAAKPHGKPGIAPGNAGERRFLRSGMSDAEVIARVGPPDIRTGNIDSRGGARWSYLPTDGDPGMITTLHFRAGVVADVERKPAR
jgi:hypothetical protein